MAEEKIPVIIFGQTYEILGNSADSLYYNSLARYVENKMRQVQENTNIISSQKVAILAALNIADELFHERENKSDSAQTANKKIEDMLEVLDKVLKVEDEPAKKSTVQKVETEPVRTAKVAEPAPMVEEKLLKPVQVEASVDMLFPETPRKKNNRADKTEEPAFDFWK